MADLKAPTATAQNQAIDQRRPVTHPVDREALAKKTGGSADDGYKAQLGHEKHLLNCLETAAGKAAFKLKNLDPSLEQIVAHGGEDLPDAVLTLHKDLFRSRGGTELDFPMMNGTGNELWSKVEALLTQPSKYFADPALHAKHIAWWKANGVPCKKANNIGRSLTLTAAKK